MAKPRKARGKPGRGKSLASALGRGAIGAVPGGSLALGVHDALRPGGGGGGAPKKPSRSRGMHIRKGRLFMGFTQKEVKAAMRRTYGGRKGKK